MSELRILFAAAEGPVHRVRLADAEGREVGVEAPFTPFLDDKNYEDLRWYLEDYMDLPDGGAVLRAQRIEGILKQWGRRLYNALFTAEDNRKALKDLLDGPEPRRLTIATQNPTLLRLPWELMADEAGNLAQRLSVRRQLEVPETDTARPVQLPLRILYIVSRPADTGFLDPRLTAKALFDALCFEKSDDGSGKSETEPPPRARCLGAMAQECDGPTGLHGRSRHLREGARLDALHSR